MINLTLSITMVRALLSFLAIMSVVGCDAVSRTELLVERPADLPQSKQFNADVLKIVSETAAQFGFHAEEQWKPHNVYTDQIGGENPSIVLQVYPGELFVVMKISEKWIDRRTSKHRKFVDLLVTNLNTRGLHASVTSHTSDSVRWVWFFVAALCVATFWLVWRRFRQKPLSPNESSSC